MWNGGVAGKTWAGHEGKCKKHGSEVTAKIPKCPVHCLYMAQFLDGERKNPKALLHSALQSIEEKLALCTWKAIGLHGHQRQDKGFPYLFIVCCYWSNAEWALLGEGSEED